MENAKLNDIHINTGSLKMYTLAVIGNPIEHSLSPLVWNLFAEQNQIKLDYQKILATTTDDFIFKVQEFFSHGGIALNITSPFKHQAYQLASKWSDKSKLYQVANFLYLNHDKQIVADTTDGIGLINDLELNLGFQLQHKNILILGSGYVLDSILGDLLSHKPANINILARNVLRMQDLTNKFAISRFMPDKNYDLIINTVPNVATNELFKQITRITNNTVTYDMLYRPKITNFLDYMTQLNPQSKNYNGLGMLVEQAKVCYSTLFNYIPNTQNIIERLACIIF